MPPFVENFLQMGFAKYLIKYASNPLRFFLQTNQNLYIFQVFCEFHVIFFLSSKNENCLVKESFVIIIIFILYKLATMTRFGWHPPHLVDNTDLCIRGTSIDNRQCSFLKDFSLFMCPSVCLHVSQLFSFLCNLFSSFLRLYIK